MKILTWGKAWEYASFVIDIAEYKKIKYWDHLLMSQVSCLALQVTLKKQIFVFITEKKLCCAEKFSHITEKPTNRWITKDITLDADNLS